MDEMIERIAGAIGEADRDSRAEFGHNRDDHRESARAAIKTARDPTDAMVAAALEAMSAPPDPEDFRRGWRAAINALLSPG